MVVSGFTPIRLVKSSANRRSLVGQRRPTSGDMSSSTFEYNETGSGPPFADNASSSVWDRLWGCGDLSGGGGAEGGRPMRWGMLGLSILIVATASGNILVCLAVSWERRLQNMTNYFLMSLAIADLLVSLLVMPLAMIVEIFGEYTTSSSGLTQTLTLTLFLTLTLTLTPI